jgi:glycine reductase complex component B subunit gamma
VISKELEKAGIPTAQVCNMTPVATAVGTPRIFPSASIKYPFGAPNLPVNEEKAERVKMLNNALAALTK